MDDRPSFRIVEQAPWSDPHSYRPDPIKALRQRLRQEDARREQVHAIVEWLMVALIIGATIYFAAELIRPLARWSTH